MNNQPLVSILTTAYNREKYIGMALESALASTYQNIEIIVVDDCSKDNTVNIVKEYAKKDQRIKLFINEKNLGDYNNRNKAASYASGKYIVYLDSDDLMYYHSIEIAVNYMERYPEAGFGLCSFYDKKTQYPVCIAPRQIYEESFFDKFGHFNRAPASAIFKLDVFKKVGQFSGLRLLGDTEFLLKIARTEKMVKIEVPFSWYRSDNEDKELKSNSEKVHEVLRRQVYTTELNHPDCPLTRDEVKKIIKTMNQTKLQMLTAKLLKKIGNIFS